MPGGRAAPAIQVPWFRFSPGDYGFYNHIPEKQQHYRDYYDDETRKIVADWYAPEIDLLHYEF